MTHVVVTLGDPAGIGPEVSEKALEQWLGERQPVGAGASFCGVTVVGPAGVVEPLCGRLSKVLADRPIVPNGAHAAPGAVRIDAAVRGSYAGPMGSPSAQSGAAALAALHGGIDLVLSGVGDVLVTAPISKEALAMAGSAARGHTEVLTERMGVAPPALPGGVALGVGETIPGTAMAFLGEQLNVVLASAHVSLSDAVAQLSEARVARVAQLFERALAVLGGRERPRLALAGLNPHAGEAGLLGREEQELLLPVARTLRRGGMSISDPLPPDTVFRQALGGAYDGVVALYHDQGLIPVKLLSRGAAVNVTLGLSKPRTSPDHGTAFDIAGKGVASVEGMLAALRMAERLVRV